MAALVALSAMGSGAQDRAGRLVIFGSDGETQQIEVSPAEYLQKIFPQGTATINRLDVKWKLPGVPVSGHREFAALRPCIRQIQDLNSEDSATCEAATSPDFPALIYQGKAVLVGELFYGENESSLREMFHSLGVTIRNASDAVDFAEFYAGISYHYFAEPKAFVLGSFHSNSHQKFIRVDGDFGKEKQEMFRPPSVGKISEGYSVNFFTMMPGNPTLVENWRFEISKNGLRKVCDRSDWEFAVATCVGEVEAPIQFTPGGVWDGVITTYPPHQFEFSDRQWIASDGPDVGRMHEMLDSNDRSSAELQAYLGSAPYVIERGMWSDKDGRVRGERVLLFEFNEKSNWVVVAEILLTDGKDFYAIRSKSLRNALAFDAIFEK
ncbi:MAG TPA: hypothetical protein VJR23_02590 [Candidatus Acidoferrales bacterium]|nr:hypothetical protein [Candidatus Acidoferrales bacterium]